MLSPDELVTFADTGLVRLPGAFRREDAHAMEEMVWRFVTARGTVRDDPSTWLPGAVAGLSPKVKRKATFQLGLTDTVTAVLDQLLDGDWDRPTNCGGVLVTFPDCVEWTLPHGLWHADTHLMHDPDPLFGVKLYAFINTVRPGQGGTCVLSGGHHLVRRYREANASDLRSLRDQRRLMTSNEWLLELSKGNLDDGRTQRLMESTTVDGYEVRVVELTGEPGDVVLAHPWALHCIAPNAADQPRMMTSKNIWRRGVQQVAP
jgi:hypothetical protein